MAFAALRAGGAAPIVLNAANECAVAAFLDERIAYLDIARFNEMALDALDLATPLTLEDVVEADARTRAWMNAHVLHALV